MIDRTKLTIVSLAVMMLPYRIDFPVTFLLLTAILCFVLDTALETWARRRMSRSSLAALILYRRLRYQPSPGGLTP